MANQPTMWIYILTVFLLIIIDMMKDVNGYEMRKVTISAKEKEFKINQTMKNKIQKQM